MSAKNEDVPEETSTGRGAAVERAIAAIQELIITRQLFPGQPLRQDELSSQIGMSRGVVREALQALSKEGMVTHPLNRGYAVTRFSYHEMEQLYLLRELIEAEVLRSIPRPSPDQVDELKELNAAVRRPGNTIEDAMHFNREFHFRMFGWSPHELLVRELDRLWKMSAAYRAMSIGVWSERAEMMADSHDAQISALASGDYDRLVWLSNEHRQVSLIRLKEIVR